MKEEIECAQCKERVEKKNYRQKFCSEYCKDEYKRKESIRKWVERKPRKPDPNKAARMEMSALYNNTGGWMRKFSTVRG